MEPKIDKISLTPKEEDNAWKRMEDALALRDDKGLIYPIIPTGDGVILRSMGPVRTPVWEPGHDGLINPLIFPEEFSEGRTPENLRYETGHFAIDNQTGQVRMFYDNPIYNLPLQHRLCLQQPSTLPSSSIPEPPVLVSARPVWGTSQGMVVNTNEGPALLSNFEVHATLRKNIKQRNTPDAEELELDVTCGGEHRMLTIAAAELENVVPMIVRKFPSCYTNVDASKASARIANAIRDQLPSLPTSTVIKSPGFIKLDGLWVYAHDAAKCDRSIEFRTGCTIPCNPQISPQQALHAAIGVLELSENLLVTLPLLILAHLGPCYAFFEAAGFPPHFVSALIGSTGSFKTAIAQALFRPFKELPETPEASFRDTPTALEVKIGEASGRTLVVDDYQPAVTSTAGRENLGKLEHVVRLFGDGIAKSRSNSELGRAKEFKPAGCCLITGEDSGGSHSTLLRCLTIPIKKGDIDGRRLKFYQDNPDYLRTHLYHFLEWAGLNGDALVDFIKQEFQPEREYFAAALQEPRQVDIAATLMLMARIILRYAQAITGDTRISDVQDRWRAAIISLLMRSEEQSREMDPVEMYLEAVFALNDTGKIQIAPTQAAFRRGHHIGFVKEGTWWLFPADIYAKVTRFWQEQKIVFPLTSGKIHALLAQSGLIKTASEKRKGCTKVLYMIKSTLEGRPRMLVLRVEQARAHVENSEKQEENNGSQQI